MTPLSDLLGAWETAMWRASWQGGLVAMAVWCACRLAPSMPARFQSWLWRLAVVKFAVVLFCLGPVGLPLMPASEPATVGLNDRSLPDRSGMGGGPAVRHEPSGSDTPWLIAFLAWSAVVGCQTVRILRSCHSAHRLRSGCRPSQDEALLGQLAAAGRSFGFDKPPAVLEADGDGSPMLVGILRPAIVVPANTLGRLDRPERAMVIGHELAHLRRGDLIWGLIAAAVRAVFFFHPLAWLCERRLGATQEIAADELAVSRQDHDPVGYARLLVSVVGKLGPGRVLPEVSLGAAGLHRSLKQRLHAMRFMKPVSRPTAIAYSIALGMFAALGVVPWAVVPARASAADKPDPREAVDQGEKRGWGRFVSFRDGTLTLDSNAGVLLAWARIAEGTKAFKFDPDAGEYKQVEGTAVALDQVKAGTWVIVGDGKAVIRIGARKGQVTGTLVSFKEGRLLMLGKDLGPSYTKKYGNNLHFNKFRDDVPVQESIDGGEYRPIGTANQVLGGVKEGTVLTVHGEGDDNITLIQIGVKR